MMFVYDKEKLSTEKVLIVSLGDLRDLVQAIYIANESQREYEIQTILASVCRKNLFKPGAIDIRESD